MDSDLIRNIRGAQCSQDFIAWLERNYLRDLLDVQDDIAWRNSEELLFAAYEIQFIYSPDIQFDLFSLLDFMNFQGALCDLIGWDARSFARHLAINNLDWSCDEGNYHCLIPEWPRWKKLEQIMRGNASTDILESYGFDTEEEEKKFFRGLNLKQIAWPFILQWWYERQGDAIISIKPASVQEAQKKKYQKWDDDIKARVKSFSERPEIHKLTLPKQYERWCKENPRWKPSFNTWKNWI